MPERPWEPDRAWLDARFERVKSTLFRDRPPEQQPAAVLLGGQPGAGKTRAAAFARSLHAEPLVVINGDDFRALHPDFKRLQRDEPQQMPAVTQAVSGPMVARSIKYAKQQRVSVLVEGTFRDPAMVTGTAAAFQKAGFEVHVVALAVPPEVSRASTMGRYLETLGTDQNRWTPPTAHEASVRGMPDTVQQLAASPAVARVTVLSRDGTVLADSSAPGTERAQLMRSTLERVHQRELTTAERAAVAATVDRAQRISGTSGAPVDVDVRAELVAELARASFGRPATEATRTRPDLSVSRPPGRPSPSAGPDRAPGRGD